jgi:pimeloyl-ACP methyl ester carboxylesterase
LREKNLQEIYMDRKDRMEPARRAQLSGIKRALALLALTLMAVAGAVPLFHQKAVAVPPQPFGVSIYHVKGVEVHKYTPIVNNGREPIVMVHGGSEAGWVWDKMASELSSRGWEVHVLDWYNHGTSRKLPESQFIQRSIQDVAREEITFVVEKLGRQPMLIGHSMGGMASMVYAETHPVTKLVLFNPVLPTEVGAAPIPIPVDFSMPFPPFTPAEAKVRFWPALPDDQAAIYQTLLAPESPVAVFEATRWTISVDLSLIQAPTLVFGAELDVLTPPADVQRLAEMMGAQFVLNLGIGHTDTLLTAPAWLENAGTVDAFLKADPLLKQ